MEYDLFAEKYNSTARIGGNFTRKIIHAPEGITSSTSLSMKPYRIGIIGYGGFGRFLHQSWRALPEVTVTAIADVRPVSHEGLDGIRITTDWKDFLTDDDIDVVAIVTEPSTHEEMATALMAAGKAMLVEKPLAQDAASARRIVEARDRSGAIAAIDLIMRFNPLLIELRELTQAGVFGRLRRVDVENYAQDESLPPWFWDKARSGGILVEHAVHFIDLVHFLQPDEVVAVNGLTHHRNPDQEDQVMANILYAGGLMTTHYHSFARPGFFEKTRIRLAYDLADIDLHGWIPLGGEASVLVNPDTRARLEASPFFQSVSATPVDRVADDSRPEGWGVQAGQHPLRRRTIKAGGEPYEVTELVTGRFDQQRSKLDVYATCVRESLLDVCKRLGSSSHVLAAPLEHGLVGLELGERAAASGRQR